MVREALSLDLLRGMEADDAAALWIARRHEGFWPHEREQFDAWIGLSEANAAAWKRAQRGWAAFDEAGSDELIEAMRAHAREALPAPTGRWRGWAVAAALICTVGVGTILVTQGGNLPWSATQGEQAGPALASLDYRNGREQAKTVVLPDGSRVTLDAGTHLTAEIGAARRSLRLLEGRAFFAVEHHADRPFVVRAGAVGITALGTQFDVRTDGSGQRVHLVEGRVSVAIDGAASAPIVMEPGQRMIVRNGVAEVSATNMDEALNWQQGFATFENQTLSDVAKELNRYGGGTLVVRDPRIAGLRVTGVFRTGDAERFGSTLEQIHPVRVVKRGPDTLEIVPR